MIAPPEAVTPEDLKNTPCVLAASGGQLRTETTYHRKIMGLRGEFLFADSLEEARLHGGAK